MRKQSVGIVGAGIAGISAARHLAERGHHVTLFEQHPMGHELGSSHGKSRIVRRAYADSFYTECMAEAYPMWAELERASGEKLLHEVGLLYFGKAHLDSVKATERGLKNLHVPYHRFAGEAVTEVFPALSLSDDEIGLFTPEAGWVSADAALAATWSLAMKAGVVAEAKKAGPVDLKLFDRVLITAGAWIKEWWPSAPVTVTLQTFAYVDAAVSGPVWIEDAPDLLYGFPSDSLGLKVGVHRPGPKVDPSSLDRSPGPAEIEAIRAFAVRRLGLANPAVTHGKGCLYTTTETEDFLISQLGEKMIVASACSGHGFKFGPWFGKLLADVVEERTDIACYSRFMA